METMICSICYKEGIHWVNLGTINQYTRCPHCKHTNCQIVNNEENDNYNEGLQDFPQEHI